MLEIRHLTKRFGPLAAIDDISLSVRPGEIVGLLGRNGAGKTTLLRMASGTLAPTGGEVSVDGLDLFDGSPAARALVGYLPEGCPLPCEATVGEYLRFRSSLYGLAGKRAAARARAAARSCGLRDVENTRVSSLSNGMRVRCALADAISHSAHALLLDEPLAGLDPVQIKAVLPIIEGAAKKAAVLMSTHLLSVASRICTRFIILDHGRIASSRDADGSDPADWFFSNVGGSDCRAGETAVAIDGAAGGTAPSARQEGGA